MKGIASRTLVAVRNSVRRSLFARTVRMRNRRAIISFTFDDCPSSAVLNGARLLENHGVRGTFYLAGSYCGQVVEDIPQYSAADLLALAAAGHEIGCHTFTHPRVSTLSAAALEKELELNATFLARELPGLKLRTFAYPFGDVSFAATMRLQSKFGGCRSSEPGLNMGTADLGRLRSIRLYDHLFDPYCILDLIKQAVATNAWLIFYTHDVEQAPSAFGCTPALLEYALKAAISAGAEVRPVDAAIELVAGACRGEAEE